MSNTKAEEVDCYTIGIRQYPRIRYGDEQRFGPDWHAEVVADASRRCHDCGATAGEYHEPGCDMEDCPRCGGQSIACGCDGDPEVIEELHAAVEMIWPIIEALATSEITRDAQGSLVYMDSPDEMRELARQLVTTYRDSAQQDGGDA